MITVVKQDEMTWVAFDNFRKPMIYLDHCALRHFSSNKESRERFFSIFQTKGTLCFSWMNFYDIGGNNTGQSLKDMKDFTDTVGENWFPIHWNPHKVMENEKALTHMPFIDLSFIQAYYPFIHGSSLTLTQAIELALCPEVQKMRHKKIQQLEDFRRDVNTFINDKRAKDYGKRTFQDVGFDSNCPTVFVHDKLLSLIIKQGKVMKDNHDLIDFWHAVVSLSYADMVVLDGEWEDHARQIKIPEGRVKCCSVKEEGLKKFLEDFEKFDNL
ncbi:MAG: hypothetical protein Q7S13_00450 [Candidatus Omnitrophota bacterium]|nr:hypothetical protein [Candidatus Omnitrophota bacterium]